MQKSRYPTLALECKCAFGAKIQFLFFVPGYFLLEKSAPQVHFCDSKMCVRRRSCCRIVCGEVMGRPFSTPSCSQWVWGKARERLPLSGSRFAYPFRRSDALYDLSNTSTLKNIGTVIWHSIVSAPSARKFKFRNYFFV